MQVFEYAGAAISPPVATELGCYRDNKQDRILPDKNVVAGLTIEV